MPTVRTDVLDIDYTDDGDGSPVVLVHGWPDAAVGWRDVRAGLLADGHRVVVPSLRGSGRTRFREDDTVRDGTGGIRPRTASRGAAGSSRRRAAAPGLSRVAARR